MADIFLSYAREDRAAAAALAVVLQQLGWTVWWDRELTAGSHYARRIETELHQARCVIVLWSASSLLSDWVHDEAEEARQRNILVPALIAEARPPIGFRRYQSANLLAWNGSLDDAEFQSMVRTIETHVPRRVVEPSPRTRNAELLPLSEGTALRYEGLLERVQRAETAHELKNALAQLEHLRPSDTTARVSLSLLSQIDAFLARGELASAANAMNHAERLLGLAALPHRKVLSDKRAAREELRSAQFVVSTAEAEFQEGMYDLAIQRLAEYSPPHELVTKALADLRRRRAAPVIADAETP